MKLRGFELYLLSRDFSESIDAERERERERERESYKGVMKIYML